MKTLSKYGLFGVASVVIYALDQWSKWVVHKHMHWTETLILQPGLFALTYVRNTGAAFGLFRNAPPWFHDPFFIALPVVVLFGIVMYLVVLSPTQRVSTWALGLVFGGAIGNLTDRLRFGYVIDFLDFYWNGYHWPAFNIADAAVVSGIVLLTLPPLLFPERRTPQLNRLSDL
jgi:signal peptidase II